MKRSNTDKDFINVSLVLQNQELFAPTEIPVFPAETDYSLNEAIVNKPSDFYLIVQAFSCSLANVPVFIPDIQPDLSPYFNTDINKTLYSFTMEYNGIFGDQTYMDYISQNPNKYVRPISATHPLQDRTTTYYNIYTYTTIAEMLTNTLAAAFADLASKIILPTTDVPYIYFDQSTQKFVLIANKAYFASTLAVPIKIYCNYFLFELIYSFPNSYLGDDAGNVTPGQDFIFYIADQGNNVVSYPGIPDPAGDYLSITQNNSSIYSFFPLKSVFIVTNSIPVNSEIAQTKPLEFIKNPNNVNKLKVLLDISPVIIGNLIKNRNYIQYRPTIDYPIELISDDPLIKINYAVYWRDRFGNPYLLYLNNNQPSNLTLQFIKKSVYKK